MSRTIFVGNLPLDIRHREVEDLFYKYGRIVDVDLKLPSRPPGFAFVEFSDARDASDAVRGRDGYDFADARLRVELARGGPRGAGGRLPPRGPSRGPRMDDRRPPRGGGGGGGFAPPRSTGFRLMVTGLPKSASWQDVKDHFRKAGDVTFTQVFRDRDGTMGIVDFATKDDMKYAIRKMDDTEFKNPFEKSYIRVKEDNTGRSRSRSRSRSFDSRSPSRSRSYDSHSRSKSPRSASPASRSRSRSPVRSKKSRSASPIAQSPGRPRSRSVSPVGRSASPADKAVQNGRGRSASRSVSPMQSD